MGLLSGLPAAERGDFATQHFLRVGRKNKSQQPDLQCYLVFCGSPAPLKSLGKLEGHMNTAMARGLG